MDPTGQYLVTSNPVTVLSIDQNNGALTRIDSADNGGNQWAGVAPCPAQ